MSFAEYDRYDGIGLAELVRTQEISPRELLAEARARCDRINVEINAVIHRCDAAAEKATENTDLSKSFTGVPFLIKDLGSPLAGAPLTRGSRLFRDYVPVEDGELVRRFKAAGLVTFGKTNVPEFGLVPVTESELHGPCLNPWNLNHTPGGSSGGAAAAVAAGIVPVAHASDGGGSIRIPASCCGIFGLKPSRGLNPLENKAASIIEDFVAEHVVSRSVRDTAGMLDAVCNQTNPQFLAGLDTPTGRLRIAIVRSPMLGAEVAPEVRAALDHSGKALADLGHHVEDAEPKIDYDELRMAFLTFWAVATSQGLDGVPDLIGRKATRADVELASWTLGLVGRAMSDDDLAMARTVMWRTTKTFAKFFERYDVLVSPTLAAPPLRIGQNRPPPAEKLAMRAIGGIKSPWLLKTLLKIAAKKSFAFAAFTGPFNMTGQPAMSVPLYWTEGGLPIGTQIATRHGGDALLLRLARQLEQAHPWAHLRPPGLTR